jgi:tRNA (guanine-N7-)-methyltransferase
MDSLGGNKSYVLRKGRITTAQKKAVELFWHEYGVEDIKSSINLNSFFSKKKKIALEIGFGSGENLIYLAENLRDISFVGIEVYDSGIGSLINKAKQKELKNLKIIREDAEEVLGTFEKETFEFILLFFPDPWPKKRHHKRRLISEDFISLIESKLKPNGLVHVCTDWADYAHDIHALFKSMEEFKSLEKLPRRIQTKFEKKGLALGHSIYEFAFRLLR